MALNLTEGQLKRQVEDYLDYAQNQGKLLWLRLNAGDFIEVRGNTRRRVKGCPAGTSDLIIIKARKYFKHMPQIIIPDVLFVELKSAKGKRRPEQGAFQKLVEMQGGEYVIVRSFEELQAILNKGERDALY